MPQAHSHRKSSSGSRKNHQNKNQNKNQWNESVKPVNTNSRQPGLVKLIELDAPLQNNSLLVLMYGPFQAEMQPEPTQGVASWIKKCLQQHGLPSLVRFDYHRRAQIFRRDQFQAWLEPLMNEVNA